MKKQFIFFLLGLCACYLNVFSQIKVNSSGNVGVNNTNPSYKLDVNGNVRIVEGGSNYLFSGSSLINTSSGSMLGNTSYFWGYLFAQNILYYYTPVQYSDSKLKSDITELDSSGSKLLKLRPVKYKMAPQLNEGETIENIKGIDPNAKHIGFLAQEVQLVFPELVTTDDKGTLGIKYMELIPILIKSFQEQQLVIDDLKLRIEKLEAARK